MRMNHRKCLNKEEVRKWMLQRTLERKPLPGLEQFQRELYGSASNDLAPSDAGAEPEVTLRRRVNAAEN